MFSRQIRQMGFAGFADLARRWPAITVRAPDIALPHGVFDLLEGESGGRGCFQKRHAAADMLSYKPDLTFIHFRAPRLSGFLFFYHETFFHDSQVKVVCRMQLYLVQKVS
jgi:hypothetical protein